jgi:hypothetical protein
MEDVMRRIFFAVAVSFLCIACLAVLAAQEFQTGTIITVEKISSGAFASGTDAPIFTHQQPYKLSIQLNGSTYLCRADVAEDMDLEWVQGKEVPVRVTGRVLALKRANGIVVRLSILKTEKAA